MMLPTQGPTSSLMEDLLDLGLVESQNQDNSLTEANKGAPSTDNKKGAGYAKSDDKGGDYAGPDDGKEGYYKEGEFMLNVGDGPAGTRKNVPVRSGGLDRADVGPSASNPAKNEDDGEFGEVVTDSANNKMVPAFMIPTEQEVEEVQQQEAEQAQHDLLARAWETIHAYFAEDNDGLNEEGLRGVINACGHALNVAVEDIAGLTTDNERLSEAVEELTGLLHEAEKGDPSEGGYSDDDDDDDDDDDQSKKGTPDFFKAMKKKKGKKEESYQAVANLNESLADSSLLDEIRNIGSDDRPTRAIDAQSKLIEGFETARDSSREIVDRIVQVIADDQGIEEAKNLQLDENDERVQIARFFESIAQSAENYLSHLAEGEVPFRVAEADLTKIHSDMERGIEAMHTVE